jgi:endonuclease YncB( thermonuclease family)
MYEYTAAVRKVHDGDTMTLDVDLGLETHRTPVIIRLNGINAPELSTTAGKASLAFVNDWLSTNAHGSLSIVTAKDKHEKYGRYLAGVYNFPGGICLNNVLVEQGFAVPYMVGVFWRPKDGDQVRPTGLHIPAEYIDGHG